MNDQTNIQVNDWVRVRAREGWSLFPYTVRSIREAKDGGDARIVVTRMGGEENLVVSPEDVKPYETGSMIGGVL